MAYNIYIHLSAVRETKKSRIPAVKMGEMKKAHKANM